METYFANLNDRRLLSVGGTDAEDFLQGLITNDVRKPLMGQPIFAALLTPQGKFLHDFFITAGHETLLIDVDAEGIDDLKRRLSMYRLRSSVTIDTVPDDIAVWAIWGPNSVKAGAAGLAFPDPRLEALGHRAIGPKTLADRFRSVDFTEATEADYDRWRLSHGVPAGSKDLIREKSALLESNYDVLAAISWDKGCYMGQELTARTRYRGLVKRRLAQFTFDGDKLPQGAPILHEGRQVGDVRSTTSGLGLASMRLDALKAAHENTFDVEGASIGVRVPDYLADSEPFRSRANQKSSRND